MPQSAHFSPNGDCEQIITALIGAAKRTIRILMYELTSPDLVQVLTAAARRGVDVQVIIDKREASGRDAQVLTLQKAGVPLLEDGAHAIMHSKYCIIDGATLITGSYNWTWAAEHLNAENVIISDDIPLVAAYAQNYALHLSHSAKMDAQEPQDA